MILLSKGPLSLAWMGWNVYESRARLSCTYLFNLDIIAFYVLMKALSSMPSINRSLASKVKI